MLLSHELQVGARRAFLRKGIDTHAARHHARIGELPGDALAPMLAKGLHVFTPAGREEGKQIRRLAERRMDVAVDERKLLRGSRLANRNVHGTVSSVRPALSPESIPFRKRG